MGYGTGFFLHSDALDPRESHGTRVLEMDKHQDVPAHHVRGKTATAGGPETPKRWDKPRRRVKSMDQGEAFMAGRAHNLVRQASGQSTRGTGVLGGKDVLWRPDVQANGPRRAPGLSPDAPWSRGLLLKKSPSGKDGVLIGGRPPGLASRPNSQRSLKDDNHPPGYSPFREAGTEGPAAQIPNGVADQAEDDRRELLRLRQVAEEFRKVKEENGKLQEDLSKNKRLNKNLRKENRRLFRKQNSAAAAAAAAQEEQIAIPDKVDDPLQQHVIQQLQNLQAEKAKLIQENCQLTRDNQSLHELLHYAIGHQDGSESESETESSSGGDFGHENESHDNQNNHGGIEGRLGCGTVEKASTSVSFEESFSDCSSPILDS